MSSNLTVREAGRLGGNAVKAKYGKAHYERIGAMGGNKTAERGREFYAEIGRKGGSVKKRARKPE